MRTKRVHVPTKNTAGSHFARRMRGGRLIPASTAAALALGGIVTLAAHEATATGGEVAEAQLTGTASRSPTGRPTRRASRASTAPPPRRASRTPAPLRNGVVDPAVKPYLAPKLLAAVPVGPGPVSKPVQMVLTSPGVTTALDEDGIPEVALKAYQHAASVLAINDPSCHLPWQLVAAIGRVESDDGRFGGAMLLSNGNTTNPIYGIPLDGRPGVALVRDTNGNIAQAEGPMQFLPSTWAEYGVDGNGDGKADINNIFDAALAAGDYLCARGGDMTDPTQEAAAVLRYNDADEYVHVVLALAASYENGDAATVPMTAGPVSTPDSAGGSTSGLIPANVIAPAQQLTMGGGQTPLAPQPVAQPSPPQAGAPAPTQALTPKRTPSSSPTSVVTPMVSPTATTTERPSEGPTAPALATPAPTSTTDTGFAPVDRPSQAPIPPSTQSSSSTTVVAPVVNPTPTTSLDPSGESTTTAPTPTTTTEPAPSPSDQAGQVPTSTPTPTLHLGQTVDVGWAPAMRQVVVELLTAPGSTPGQTVQTDVS